METVSVYSSEIRSPDWPVPRVAPVLSPRLGIVTLSIPSKQSHFLWFLPLVVAGSTHQAHQWGFSCWLLKAFYTWTFWEGFLLLLLLRPRASLLNHIPVSLRPGVGCNFCRSWSGSPINSCRSGVFCAPGDVACDSEVVQMLFTYADILWVLRFMFQRETEDILRVAMPRLASCLLWEIRFKILFHRTYSNNKNRQQKNTGTTKKNVIGLISSACR